MMMVKPKSHAYVHIYIHIYIYIYVFSSKLIYMNLLIPCVGELPLHINPSTNK